MEIKNRVIQNGEMAPLPEAKPLLIAIEKTINSQLVSDAIQESRTLQMLRERAHTSLFHLNFKFEVAPAYPYDPPFHQPFPFRPTLEVIDEMSKFLEILKKSVGLEFSVSERIKDCSYFSVLAEFFVSEKIQEKTLPLSKDFIFSKPVDSYRTFYDRLKSNGERALFPEFAEAIQKVISDLKSPDTQQYIKQDKAFGLSCDQAICIPKDLHHYYKLDKDPVTHNPILFVDIRNLPNKYLAKNHQNGNILSGAKAVSVVDRIWQKHLEFKTINGIERWLVVAAQNVHQAVLDRNANGARNNPVYNTHWTNLPANNKKNDLDLVRIAFEARLKKDTGHLKFSQIDLIRDAITGLYRKIERNEVKNQLKIY